MTGPRSSSAFLVDTNVVLDVVLAREPWAAEAALLLDACARGRARGFLAGHSITTVYYIVQRDGTRALATTAVSDLLEMLTVVPMDASDFQRALALGLADYEDAVQVAACLKVGAQYIVTRNQRDYKGAPVRTYAPGQALAILEASSVE